MTTNTTRPEAIKFKLEMMAMLLMAGRNEDASDLLSQAFDLLNELTEEGVQ